MRKENEVKKILLVGLMITTLSLLVGFTVPVLAHSPTEGDSGTPDQETWQAMHEACEEGDWESMAEAAEEVHGEDFSSMPCHDESYYDVEDGGQVPANRRGGMGEDMGSGMMGGWGGMMGSGWNGRQNGWGGMMRGWGDSISRGLGKMMGGWSGGMMGGGM